MRTNRELIEGALKRVNALAGTDGKLYRDHLGWFIRKNGADLFDETTRTAGETLAYLHGLENALLFVKERDK